MVIETVHLRMGYLPAFFAFNGQAEVSLLVRTSNEGLPRPRVVRATQVPRRLTAPPSLFSNTYTYAGGPEAVQLRAWAEHILIVRGLRATGRPQDHPFPTPLYS